MRRILYRVRESNQLFVRVEARCKQLSHHHRRQTGRLRTNNRQRFITGTERTIMVRLGVLRAIARTFTQVAGNIHCQQRLILTV